MGGQSGGRVEVTNYSLDGKKLRRNYLLRSYERLAGVNLSENAIEWE
jgi:hypothetical protein